MTPRVDDFESDNLSATDDDDDDGLKEDMAALARACMIAGPLVDDHSTGARVPTVDPLLHTGDAIVPATTATFFDDDDDEDDYECLRRVQRLYQPLSVLPPLTPAVGLSDDDDEDDLETVRAIMKRFSSYNEGGTKMLVEEDQTSSPGFEGDIANGSISNESDGSELCPVSQYPNEGATKKLVENIETQLSDFVESSEPDACESSRLPHNRLSCPPVVQCFVDAIKKNRDLQRFIRGKMIELETKIEENKKIRNKIKILKDFQASCIRRTGNALSLKKDPRIQLISAKRSSAPKNSKRQKKVSAMCYGPEENSHVANYRMVLERFPLSLDRKKWCNGEKNSLLKGIKQQFQEMVLQHSLSVDRTSSEDLLGDANDMDNIIASVKDLEITPERIRKFLPKVNWDMIASMYVGGRTGAECESSSLTIVSCSLPFHEDYLPPALRTSMTISITDSLPFLDFNRVQDQHIYCRWLNCEDPLINQGAWTNEEDRSLLLIVQDMGIRNWFNIAASLGTSRTPFKCLARFQRSLNPSMLNSEWTEEEDSQLCSAVACYGDKDWQSVASLLERRTGTQCSNRWKKSLCPEKKGSFTRDEDIRLTVAVMLFGRRWNQIAKYVPGRIQSQCRDRYLNSLDPSLKWGGWTEEEDLRLEAAIAKHGYCWSKIAEEVPPRTDSQCRKRWKVLCPEQVPLLQEARKKQRSIIGSNFVDRESERPTITLNDFLPLPALDQKSDFGASNIGKKGNSRSVPKKNSSKKRAKRTRLRTKEIKDTVVHSDEECGEDVPVSAYSNLPTKGNSRSNVPKKRVKRTRLRTKEIKDTVVHSDEECGEDVAVSACRNLPKKMGSKRHTKDTQSCPKEVVDVSCNDKVKTCIGSSESQSTCITSSENLDSDDITIGFFLRNKSKEILSRFIKDLNQPSFSSGITDFSKQIESQDPIDDQSGLSQSCDTVGTKNLLVRQNVSSDRQLGKREDANTLTDDDDEDMTLACFLVDKPKKGSQTAKGRCARSSSNLKKVSASLREEDCASKPAIESDDNGPSMSKHVEEETVFGVSEPMDIIVEETDDELLTCLQNRPKRQRKRPSRFL